jgi:hypothetical protein
MTTIKVADLFCGESCRFDNGSQVGMPVFGRFAAIVRHETLFACEGEAGWYIRLPLGSTLGGEFTREEALEHAAAIAANGTRGWVADESQARVSAIENARQRHNAKARASAAYAKKFGPAV